jgi:hypothetical protein
LKNRPCIMQEAIVEAQLGVDSLSSIHFSGFK